VWAVITNFLLRQAERRLGPDPISAENHQIYKELGIPTNAGGLREAALIIAYIVLDAAFGLALAGLCSLPPALQNQLPIMSITAFGYGVLISGAVLHLWRAVISQVRYRMAQRRWDAGVRTPGIQPGDELLSSDRDFVPQVAVGVLLLLIQVGLGIQRVVPIS
jgi:hypothetical protein